MESQLLERDEQRWAKIWLEKTMIGHHRIGQNDGRTQWSNRERRLHFVSVDFISDGLKFG